MTAKKPNCPYGCVDGVQVPRWHEVDTGGEVFGYRKAIPKDTLAAQGPGFVIVDEPQPCPHCRPAHTEDCDIRKGFSRNCSCRPAGKDTPGALTREPHRVAEVYVDAQFLTLCANSEVCAESMTVDEIQFACRMALASLSRDEAFKDGVKATLLEGYSNWEEPEDAPHRERIADKLLSAYRATKKGE